jgi:AraC family transcriptional regulator
MRGFRPIVRTPRPFKDGASVPFAESASRPLIDTKLDSLGSETRNAVASDEPGSTQRQIRALQKWRLKPVVEYVENHLSEKIALSDLAAIAGLSRMHFASQFRTATGLRPHEFLLRRRIQRAEELLRNTTMPIAEVALTVGFQTQAHLTTVLNGSPGALPVDGAQSTRCRLLLSREQANEPK